MEDINYNAILSKNPFLFTGADLEVKPLVTLDILTTALESGVNWDTFGIKDSHILRGELFRIFKEAGLDGEDVFMVYFLTVAIKNKNRIVTQMPRLPTKVKTMPWYGKVLGFFKTHIVQYVTAEDFSKNKFAIVHLPSTWPGICVFCFILQRQGMANSEVYSKLTKQSYFGQLWLDPECQEENKEHQVEFWTKTVKKTNNINNNSFKAEFHEDFYANSAADKYMLISGDFKNWMPEDSFLEEEYPEEQPEDKDVFTGYSKGDILEYISTTMSEIAEAKAFLEAEAEKKAKTKEEDTEKEGKKAKPKPQTPKASTSARVGAPAQK